MIAPNPNPFTTVFVDKHGIVSFGGGINATPTATTFGDLQSQVAAPFISSFFSPALVPLDGTSPFVVNGEGGVVVQRGTADPLADVNAAPPYDATRATDAVGIIWFDATNNAETQLIIYRNGTGGDFDFRIRYGAADGDVYNNGSGLTGLAGISFGAGIDTKVMSSPPTLTPLNEVDDYFFNVRSGHLGTGAPIDTDGDGIADSVDNCRLVANSDQLDTDKDGFGDVCDNCPLVANHDQTDTNGNGIGDVCELPTVRRCYVDADNDIDLYDIFAILKATGKHVSATDPRDADGNLIVTFVDAATCAKKCTRRYCAVK